MRLGGYILKRLLLLLPVLLGVSGLTFALSHMVGDPVAAYVTSEKIPEERIQQIIKAHGLDKPLHIRYFYYMRDLLRGDWGISRSDSNRPVIESIKTYFPATLELTMVAMTFSLLIGIPAGVISAVKKDRPADHAVRIVALTGVSMPIFWLGLLLQYFLFYQLKAHGLPYLPLSQRIDPTLEQPVKAITGLLLLDSLVGLNFPAFLSALKHIAMPAFCLSYATLGLIARMMRASMLEVLRQDYIAMARAKGLPEKIIIYKHALRNAMIPTVTVAGLAFGGLLSGAVLTESIFSWPGIGRWATQAILTSDIGGIMGFALLTAIIYVVANLVVDILYAALDPRVRLG